MLNRLALVVAVSVLASSPRMVAANPITYDFTGTLSEPFTGSETLGGSLTFDATPTEGSDAGASLIVNWGGQVLTFSNSPQNPDSSLLVQAFPEYGTTTPTVAFSFLGINYGGNGISTTFSVTMYDYGLEAVPSSLASLNLPVSTSTVDLHEITGGSESGGMGVLTSYEMVSTPEPSTLVLFAGVALAALVRGHRGGSRGRRRQAYGPREL
jgi:hypothetical protein